MSHTYERVLPHIIRAKKDVEARVANQLRLCHLGAIKCQLEIAVDFLDEAITRMEKKL